MSARQSRSFRQQICPHSKNHKINLREMRHGPIRFRLFASRKSLRSVRQADCDDPIGLRAVRAARPISGICRACDYRFEAIAIYDEAASGRARGLRRPRSKCYRFTPPTRCSADAPATECEPPVRAAAGRAATARRHARVTIAFAIERPRPKPVASSMLRASSPRTNGSSTLSLLRIRNAGAVVLDIDGDADPATRGGGSSPRRRTARRSPRDW